MTTHRNLRIGLALGGGSARGWAHVGVIHALEQAGIRPDLVCGTSIGALVGAAYAAGELDHFERWVRGMGIRDVISFMDVGLSGGLLKGERVMEYFRRNFVDRPIEALPMPFGAVATALHTGTEVWMRTGSTVDAVRASIALPALFSPVVREGRMLVDGALVNPVPVSLARAMGAEIVIAVDLTADILGRAPAPKPEPILPANSLAAWARRLRDRLGWRDSASGSDEDEPQVPSIVEVVATSINIMQVRITRSRMAGDPPDVVVAPHLAHLGLLDFHRADEAIEEGRRAVAAVAANLRALRIDAA